MAGLLSKASNSSMSCRRNMAGPRMKQPLLSQPAGRAVCSGIVLGESGGPCGRGGRYFRPPLAIIGASPPCPAGHPLPAERPSEAAAARPGARQRRGPELAHALPAAPEGARPAGRGTPAAVLRAAAPDGAAAVARHARSAVAEPDAGRVAGPRAPPAVAPYAAVRASAAGRRASPAAEGRHAAAHASPAADPSAREAVCAWPAAAAPCASDHAPRLAGVRGRLRSGRGVLMLAAHAPARLWAARAERVPRQGPPCARAQLPPRLAL